MTGPERQAARADISAKIVGTLQVAMIAGRIHPEDMKRLEPLLQAWDLSFDPPESDLIVAQQAREAALQ